MISTFAGRIIFPDASELWAVQVYCMGAIGEVCKGGGHLLYGVYAGIISYVLAYPDIICQKYFEERVDQLQRQQM